LLLHGLLVALALAGHSGAAFLRFAGRWRAVMLALGLAALALAAWSVKAARPAASLAARTAGDRPYCLQVQDPDKGYRPVLSLFDLSRFEMWSSESWRYHGLLVVQQGTAWRLYNWSHRRRTWDALSDDLPRDKVPTPRCVPRTGYAERLGWRPNRRRVAQPRGDFARVRGESYLFAPAYNSRANEGEPATVSFAAQGPLFEPLRRDAGERDRRSLRAFVEVRSRDWMENLVKARSTYDLLGPAPPTAATATPDAHGVTAYVARDDQGRPQSVLLCAPQTARYPASCQHWFYADGAMWSFRQSPAELPVWHELELSLRRRVAAFEAAGARCEAGNC
jgi:hypothetical protein